LLFNILAPLKHCNKIELMSRRHIVIVSFLLAVVTLLIYLPVRHYALLNYDDPDYVTQNPVVQAGLSWTGIKWAFTTTAANNWHPLTWLSLMLDCQLFGVNAGAEHLVNVFFHAINTALLFLLLLRMTNAFWQSAFVAALFAWHPLHVESVAWVAERKDVLSAFFGLLALLAYVGYVQKRPGGESRESKAGTAMSAPDSRRSTFDYFLALFFFACGLMAKPMLVTLPFVFLLLDYWPLRRVPDFELRWSRWSRLVREKWPFFLLSAASCIVTLIAQQRGVAPLEGDSLHSRIGNAAVAYVRYLFKTVYPVDLAVLYPLPKTTPWEQVAGAMVALAAISLLVWWARRKRPYLLTGWLWYLGMLVPVIGLVQVGSQALADRYTYLPLIGVFLGVTFGLAARVRSRIAILIPLTFLVLGGCLLTNMRQLRYWQNSEALFTHTISVTKDNCIAYNNLGDALDSEGYPQKAIEYYREALRLEPHYVAVLNNLAVDLAGTGHTQEAIQHFEAALHLNPDAPGIHYNLGLVLSKNGQVEKAIAQFRMALRLQPDFADARDHLGDALLRSGYALFQNGQIPQAIAPLQEGLQIHPDHVMGRNYLGFAFLRQGQAGPAVANFQNVLELQPENVDASEYLAWVLATCPDASIRNGTRAVELAQRANQLSGGSNPAILATLAAAQAEVGHFPDAMTTAQKALALATAQTNAAVVNALKDQIGFYTTNLPFRDNSLTNIQAPTQ